MKYLTTLFLIAAMFSVSALSAQDEDPNYFSRTLKGDVNKVTEKVIAVMKEQGFGLMTEIDMDAKLKEKLPKAEMKPYKIMGFCNPAYAYKAFKIEENIGIFLPCKLVVKDAGNGMVDVVAVNPSIMAGIMNNPELKSIGDEVAGKFKEALKEL